ncbi:hypothetical protein ACTHO0_19335 [Cytobacillus praedii]
MELSRYEIGILIDAIKCMEVVEEFLSEDEKSLLRKLEIELESK